MRDQLPESISKCHSSHLWKSLSKKDYWVPSVGPSRANLDLDCILSDMVMLDGSWNLDLFRVWLLEEVIKAFWSLEENSWNAKDVFWKNSWKYQGLQGAPLANTWVNLFADGAIVNGDGSASIGVFKEELWRILDGLLVMLSKGFKRATIQTDNLEVANALQKNLMTNYGITVLRRVRRLMETEGQWCNKYVPRDFNKVIDCLAKLSLAGKSSLHVMIVPPLKS
ncbi:hypothetical protein Goarm_019287 [Gossypium armourianum]|uniref:RNase H type-1 domain-containing protein n=1 Tax=Gossypium armourianum TaxID=34283 RepID=A0A7J9IK41_9ROSI|nr:hypothetical protein [Gossypium armourianum]